MHPAGEGARRSKIRNVIDGVRLAWQASPRSFCGVLLITTAVSLMSPLAVWLGKHVVDSVVEGRRGVASMSATDAWLLAAALATLVAGQRSIGFFAAHKERLFSERVGREANRRFLQIASTADYPYFDDHAWHDRMDRAERELSFRPSELTRTLISIVGQSVTLVGMFAILFTISPVLLVLPVAAAVFPVPFRRVTNRWMHEFSWRFAANQRERSFLRDVLTDIRHAKEVRALGLSINLVERHERLAEAHLQELGSIFRRAERRSVVTVSGSVLLLAPVYVLLINAGIDDTLTPGAVAAAIAAITSVMTGVSALGDNVLLIEEHGRFLDDYFSFLALLPVIHRPAPAVRKDLPSTIDGIEFLNVSFSYPGADVAAIDGLNLTIPNGHLLALVGDNGAGKTTLVKLLMRFYDVQAGQVRVGGIDVADVEPEALRSRIGTIFQDFGTYPLTVRDNVTFGRIDRDVDDTRVWSALEQASAAAFVQGLPRGLDTVVGRLFEGGVDLSGGQWQRLALARLLYRDADVWILDEPTAALDPEAEAAIFAELKARLAGRIGIVISHRFSTVRIADEIAVIQAGRITEFGSHEELIAADGRYAVLFNLQAAGYR